MAVLGRFGLTVHVGSDMAGSEAHQLALLTLVNIARRTFLAGVEVIGLPDGPALTPVAMGRSLHAAVIAYGGRLAAEPNALWPSALIGDAAAPVTPRL